MRWQLLYCVFNVWMYFVLLQQKLPLSYCIVTWIKYFWASAAVIYSIQLFSTLTGLQQRLVTAVLRPFSNFPASSPCISVQALLNIPLFHMLLLCNLSSTLLTPVKAPWLIHADGFSLYTVWSVFSHSQLLLEVAQWSYMPESWHRQRYLSCSHDSLS